LSGVEFKRVPLSAIVDWLEPREFSVEDVENMAASLRIHGQIQPIVVESAGENVYRGVAGRLRFEGAKRAGLPEIECKVMTFKSESERVALQLAENLHRKELTPIQKGEWLKRYRETLRKELPGASIKSIMATITDSIAKLTGERISEDTVYSYIQVAEQLPSLVKAYIGTGANVGLRHMQELLRLNTMPEKQVELAQKTVHEGWTVQKLKSEVDKALGVEKPKPKPKPSWTCSLCGQQQPPEEAKTTVTLCSQCYAEFEVWKHERHGE
jgi:ParB family chromosome partitioning protein